MEIEEFEIDAMELDNYSDPTENNIQLTIDSAKYVRTHSPNTSFQEIEPTNSIKQNRIMNILNTSPHKKYFPKSSIDYGRRYQNAAIQLDKNVQKVRPMQEKPPKRDAVLVESFTSLNISVPVITNKRVVKLPQFKRTEALRQDVYDVRKDDSTTIHSEDFTLEDNANVDDDYIYPVQSSTRKVQVKNIPAPKISPESDRKRFIQTRSNKTG